MRLKGVPTIETLKATRRSPQRFRVRWNQGSRSFTDTDQREVLRFALDLVANGYRDPRELGKTYGSQSRQTQRSAAKPAKTETRTFRAVAEKYLTTRTADPGYLRKYRYALNKHAYPRFGDKPIKDIIVEDIDEIALESGLAPDTLQVLIGGRLSPIFNYAIDREWRERANPCRATLKQINVKRTMKPTLELQDAPMFFDHCYGVSELLGDFAILLYGTGLRWQEAAALTVGSINLERRVVRIRQVERAGIKGGKRIATDRGKSDSGFRDVPLPRRDDDPLIAMIKRRIQARKASEWLFTSPRGKRIYRSLVERGFKKARDAAMTEDGYGIHITPHALRRGFGHAVGDRNASEDTVKKLLGHKRFTGATSRYAFDRLTDEQVKELQPFIADLTWRESDGKKAQRRYPRLRPAA
ncbi:hypothetical protein GCM10029978_063090 [Actinoallomurus acanthiterrae]